MIASSDHDLTFSNNLPLLLSGVAPEGKEGLKLPCRIALTPIDPHQRMLPIFTKHKLLSINNLALLLGTYASCREKPGHAPGHAPGHHSCFDMPPVYCKCNFFPPIRSLQRNEGTILKKAL